MLSVYLFCAVIGGGFAILSAFGDLLDVEPPYEADGDLASDAVVEAESEMGGAMGRGEYEEAGRAAARFSLRSFSYSLFGFGAVGGALTWLGAGPAAPLTLGFAVLGGLLVGGMLAALLSYLKRSRPRGRSAR